MMVDMERQQQGLAATGSGSASKPERLACCSSRRSSRPQAGGSRDAAPSGGVAARPPHGLGHAPPSDALKPAPLCITHET